MSNPFSDIEAFIAALEKRRDQLIAMVATRKAAGSRTDAMRRQIKELQAQILQEMILLQKCKKKTPGASVALNKDFVWTEKTQSIQYFDTAEFVHSEIEKPATSNSIPMISQQQVLLRVYIDGSSQYAEITFPQNASGKIILHTAAGPVSLFPANRSVVVRPLDQIRRTNLQHTLNFLIPAAYCNGTLTFRLELTDDEGENSFYTNTQTIVFTDVPALKMQVINMHYAGPDYNNQQANKTVAPAEILHQIDDLLPVLPVAHINITGFETIEWNRPLNFDDNRDALLETISTLRTMSGGNALYIVIIPEEAGYKNMSSKTTAGAGVCLVSIGPCTAAKDMVHEIGHALGMPDASVHSDENKRSGESCTPGLLFPSGSIKEAGVDLRALQIKDPFVVTDYMSYGKDAGWTSPNGYLYLLNILKPGQFSDPLFEQSPGEKKQAEYYHLGFHRDHLNHQVILRSAFHLYQDQQPEVPQKKNCVRAYIYDYENVLMYSVYAISAGGNDTSKLTSSFQLSFPRMENMQRIQLVENNYSIGEFYIAPYAPQINITAIDFREDGENHLLHISWEGSVTGYCQPGLVYAVRYSADGIQWQTLLTDLPANWCQINNSRLPGGPACRIQIIASAGLRTSIAESYHFILPVKPRRLYWMHPKPQSIYAPGNPVYCSATAYSPNFSNALPEEIVWTSLKHGFLGTGQQLTVTQLTPGRDWIQVHIPDGLGNLLTKQVEISIA